MLLLEVSRKVPDVAGLMMRAAPIVPEVIGAQFGAALAAIRAGRRAQFYKE